MCAWKRRGTHPSKAPVARHSEGGQRTCLPFSSAASHAVSQLLAAPGQFPPGFGTMIRRGPKVPGMGSDCCCGPTRVGTQHGNHCPHVAIYMKYNEKFSCSARCERWTRKKAERQRIDVFELWCWRRLLRVLRTARRSNQSILKESSPEYSLEGLMLKLKLRYFGHLMRSTDSLEKTLVLGKMEVRRRRE